MARHGTAQHSTAWHGMAWHGTAWHGMAGMARHSTRLQCMHAVALAASFKMNRKRESVKVHALMMPGGKPQMESTPASPTSQTAGVKMAVLDPTGILTGAGLRGSMARMHGVLAARAGKVCLHTCRPDMHMQGWSRQQCREGWGGASGDLLLLFIPRYCSLLLFNQIYCYYVVPVRTLEHCSVLNV